MRTVERRPVDEVSWFRKHWLGAAGLLVGLLGLTAAVFFYAISQERRTPVFGAPRRIEIFTARTASEAQIKVFSADGQPVTRDVTAVRWYFWNSGRKSIRRDNILDPLRIRIGDASGRILAFRLTKTSRPVARILLDRDPADSARSLALTFQILEEEDGASGQLIYEGDRKTPIEITGVIEGVRSIRSLSDLAKRERWLGLLKYAAILFGVLSALVIARLLLDWLVPRFPHWAAIRVLFDRVMVSAVGIVVVSFVSFAIPVLMATESGEEIGIVPASIAEDASGVSRSQHPP